MTKRCRNKDQTKLHETATARFATPDVRIDFGLDKIGYQMDVYVNGEAVMVECRDFSGVYKIPDLRMKLAQHLIKAVARFREKH